MNAVTSGSVWEGGTESHSFNRLEEIALGWAPETPVLGCKGSDSTAFPALEDILRKISYFQFKRNHFEILDKYFSEFQIAQTMPKCIN